VSPHHHLATPRDFRPNLFAGWAACIPARSAKRDLGAIVESIAMNREQLADDLALAK
jgi:hypothetical protein